MAEEEEDTEVEGRFLILSLRATTTKLFGENTKSLKSPMSLMRYAVQLLLVLNRIEK